MTSPIADPAEPSTPILVTTIDGWPAMRDNLSGVARSFVQAMGFEPKAGRHLLLPESGGAAHAVVFLDDEARPPAARAFALGGLASVLPGGAYRIESTVPRPELAALAWLLDGYRFDTYRAAKVSVAARLVAPAGVDAERVARLAAGVGLGRDLINSPANDLGPDGLEAAARDLAGRFGARVDCTVGEALLDARLPMIHAVGRASSVAPRLIDIEWGDRRHPKVTLVGKGVTFDTGGLNIKPDASMLLMKKDMGGAATALAAACMIMGEGLPVRLRVLVPAVENAISGASFRPGDILRSRKGLSVEIGNTDAEGRLILADALALADEEEPGLIIDFATLTGAARVALGPDLPAFFTDDDGLAREVEEAGTHVGDPVWRLPLWKPYDDLLSSRVADVNHISSGGFAGAVTAALFLKRFVERAAAYAHFDIFAWTPTAKPGRPVGGEAQVARLVMELLERRYPRRS